MAEGKPAAPATLSPSPLQIKEFRNLLPIGVVVAMGFGLVIPVLPSFARSFGVSIAAVGLVQLVFGFTRFSFGIVGGLVVDRFGVRASTIIGILIVSASSFASAEVHSFGQLVLARGFGGAGSALFIAGLMNRVLQVVPPSAMGRATGIWRTSFLVGIGIGPLIGGVLRDSLGLRAPFRIYAVGLLIAAVIAWFQMGPSHGKGDVVKRSPLDAIRAARPLFKDIRYVVALLGTLVAWWTISGPAQQIAAIFADEELRFSGTAIGAAIALLSLGEVSVIFFAGRLADRYGRRVVLVPALVVAASATVVLGQSGSAHWLFFVSMLTIGGTIAAVSVSAGGLLADSIPKGGSGTAVGVNQMAGDLGYMIAPVAIGSVVEAAGYPVAYMIAAIPAALVTIVALRLPAGPSAPAQPSVEQADEHVG